MKALIFFLVTFFFNANLKAQAVTKDSVSSRNFDKILQTDDYGNTNYSSSLKERQFFEYQVASTIVVIGDKIYKLDSKEYKEKRKSSDIPIIIKDEKSKSDIKTIIIYK